MRALWLTTTFPRSDTDPAGRFMLDWATQMVQRGWSIQVLAPGAPEALGSSEIGGVRVDRFPCAPRPWPALLAGSGLPEQLERHWGRWLLVPLLIIRFLQAALRAAPSAALVHAHWLIPAGWVARVIKCRYPKLPVVVTCHAADLDYLRRLPGGRLLARWIIRGVDRCTTLGAHSELKLRELIGEAEWPGLDGKLVRFTPGIDWAGLSPEPCAAPRPETGARVLYLGRLVPIKGVRVLLEALAGVPGVRATIAGWGEDLPALRALTERLGLSVEFVPPVIGQAKRTLLANHDIVAFPSLHLNGRRSEGLPVTLLEAMAGAKAVVASRTGAIPEVVSHEVNGLLVPPGDVAQWRAALERLIQDRPLCQTLGARARTRVQSFDWTARAQDCQELYEQLLA